MEKATLKEKKRSEKQALVEQKAREKLMTPNERLNLKLTRMGQQKEEKARLKEGKELAKRKLAEEKEAAREQRRTEKESRLQHKKLEDEAKCEEKERQQNVLRRLSGASSTPSVVSATRGEGNGAVVTYDSNKSSLNEAASVFQEMDGQAFANARAESERAARLAEEREQKRLAAAGVVLAANNQARLAREAQWRAEEAVRSEERQFDRIQAEAEAEEARERRRMQEMEANQAKLEQVLISIQNINFSPKKLLLRNLRLIECPDVIIEGPACSFMLARVCIFGRV